MEDSDKRNLAKLIAIGAVAYVSYKLVKGLNEDRPIEKIVKEIVTEPVAAVVDTVEKAAESIIDTAKDVTTPIIDTTPVKNKPAHLIKGSQEAKDYFAKLRAKKKDKHKGHETTRGLAQDQKLISEEKHEVAYQKKKRKYTKSPDYLEKRKHNRDSLRTKIVADTKTRCEYSRRMFKKGFTKLNLSQCEQVNSAMVAAGYKLSKDEPTKSEIKEELKEMHSSEGEKIFEKRIETSKQLFPDKDPASLLNKEIDKVNEKMESPKKFSLNFSTKHFKFERLKPEKNTWSKNKLETYEIEYNQEHTLGRVKLSELDKAPPFVSTTINKDNKIISMWEHQEMIDSKDYKIVVCKNSYGHTSFYAPRLMKTIYDKSQEIYMREQDSPLVLVDKDYAYVIAPKVYDYISKEARVEPQ